MYNPHLVRVYTISSKHRRDSVAAGSKDGVATPLVPASFRLK